MNVYMNAKNDAMKYANVWPEHTRNHTQTLHPLRNDFWVSSPSISVTFWLCIPLGTTFELRNLLCAPLGTTFVASSPSEWFHLCIPLGMTFELFPILFALDGADLNVTCYILGGIWPLYCIGLNKKEWKLQPMAPLKTFLPSWKEKGTIGKRK